ncbi:epimerase [Thioclava dalianensis]|uniref:Epimerase n=1 Tax=Thioclava dalianensis TaxID=1185766 RepID=A0A074U6W2_9RHOB|nr:SDR family oxidoreductase [Thioclava dalianensis]KEP70412.1 epimerase [Thioclava dalianensis]SFN31533.1 Nucleoside-diphosphate-sugar epimerase [Thioclava dalianensis]
MPVLLSIGHGFSAQALTPLLLARGWRVIGTTRSPEKAAILRDQGVEPVIWEGGDLPLEGVTHLMSSVPPGADGDPVLNAASEQIAQASAQFDWIGYHSTVGVYGDHAGGWVDEATPLTPSTRRGQARVEAEAAWGALASAHRLPLHYFRLAGIYGPGRGPFEKVRRGTARRVIKPGQVFSRIHVADIAQVLLASIDRPDPGAIYNVCDDDPAPPQDVIGYAAELLGVPQPPEVYFETAEMSPMARSFYAESKRVRNDKIKQDLGVELLYPDYRVGLRALLDQAG